VFFFYLYFICYVLFYYILFFSLSLILFFPTFVHSLSFFSPCSPHRHMLVYCRISSSFELSVFKTYLYSTHRWAEHSDQYGYSLHFIHANKHVEVHVCSSGITNMFTVCSKSGLSELLGYIFISIFFVRRYLTCVCP